MRLWGIICGCLLLARSAAQVAAAAPPQRSTAYAERPRRARSNAFTGANNVFTADSLSTGITAEGNTTN